MSDQLGLCDVRNCIEKSVRNAAAINTLTEIVRAFAASSDIQEMFEQIMTQVSRLLNPKVWSLLLKNEHAGELELAAGISDMTERLNGTRLSAGQGIAEWVAENSASVITLDVRCDLRFAVCCSTDFGQNR